MKTAIVTGASGGIGREIAKQLIMAGYTVYGTYFKNEFNESLQFIANILLYPMNSGRNWEFRDK